MVSARHRRARPDVGHAARLEVGQRPAPGNHHHRPGKFAAVDEPLYRDADAVAQVGRKAEFPR